MQFTVRSKRLAGAAVAAALTVSLASCASTSSTESDAPTDGSLGTINVGALAVPAGELLTWLDENAAADAGLDIEWTEFTDFNTPNTALAEGSIDANLFQNETFLKNYNEASGTDLVSVGEVYLPVAAFYSDKVTSIDELEDGAKIAIPDDPTNEGRALEMLAAEGLIETTEHPTVVADITDNPHDFEFVEAENASLPGVLPDVDAAFVTISFALPAGLKLDDAILVEGQGSKYFNVLATTSELEDDPRVQKLYELLLSDETQAYMEETYGDQMIPVAK
ncbi:MetQ/NlpA family ABC transporter substrate-binding protein [Salinibacterium sp. ZJ450]|uniref:MetQ/NlpA family ABC transporter substrate-binding protein n=1 Tax=Salinibacterium sp. ZJ450 TaxID=2708338 RepID=UPI00141EBFE0|nr:MetQ/NlpA family ABC transporter substrate-binding protein [Salinibacterium sp. ZJ450]